MRVAERSAWLVCVVSALSAGCGGEAGSLLVDVRTDLVPAREFASVHTQVLRDGETEIADTTIAADRNADYGAGQRAAELREVAEGPVVVRVALLDASGAEVLARRLRFEIRGTTAVTVVFTRSCVAVACPGPGDDAEATECSIGRCVPPECGVRGEDACGETECAGDADCTAAVACAEPLCVDGACLAVPNHAICGTETWCHPERGCVADAGDAGTPPDAATVDGGPIDAAAPDGDAPIDAGTTDGGCVATGTCPDCTTDGDCPPVSYGAWTACGSFSETCDETGERSRGVTSWACSEGSCVPSTGTETGSCSRDTDGTGCGAVEYGTWSACGSFSGTCDESGTRSRSVTTYACAGGACDASTGSESGSCSRMTDGVTCAATEYGPYGVCGGFTSTCDETGTQSRTVTTYACAAEACSAATGSESGACVRDTDGTACTRGGAFPCHATRCVSGGCNIVGDSCGTGICCEFGCQPMGTVCP